ncbi:odorant receptor 22c-like [Culicoides brevitarsis]|uniref:odorant receptor 22c-like n=1 Tax=Culicoides brevitarsis TaxID=469753 RepID=UPI00307C0FD1
MYPVNIVIPGINPKSYPAYPINYVNISFMTFWTATSFVAFDSYFFLLALYMASRFELCGENFSKLGCAKQYSTADYVRQSSMLHDKTIELYESLQEMVEWIVALQIYANVFIMACGLVICLINPWNSYYLVTAANTTQAFLFCAFGEMVALKSAGVSDAIYSSKWYDIDDIHTKKILVLVMTRSQQPFFFNFKGRNLSLETFTSIMTTGFRVFNMALNFI